MYTYVYRNIQSKHVSLKINCDCLPMINNACLFHVSNKNLNPAREDGIVDIKLNRY